MAKNKSTPKTGVSMGRIENTNIVGAIPCNCNKCCHSYKKSGVLYCSQYGKVDQDKKKCKRYAARGNDNISRKEYKKLIEEKNKRTEPIFPWDHL